MHAASRPPACSSSLQRLARVSCRGSPGKIVERLREITARMRWLVGRENAAAMILENFRWSGCRCCRVLERPAEILACMPAADLGPVVVQHFIVETIDQSVLIHQSQLLIGHDS